MKPRDLAELVRLPAVLTVPGDTITGAAAASWPLGGRTWGLPLASTSLYWAGMALNDYADRHLDAIERPERPIPSGRISAHQALAIAGGLTVAGLGIAAAAGGKRALGVATPLAATVWAYDLALKETPLGPAAMASARGLDVLLGATGRVREAVPSAATVAVHTAAVTTLSRGEVHGGRRGVAAAALATTLTVAGVAGAPIGARRSSAAVAAGVLATTYGVTVGSAQKAAADRPDAPTVRRATGAGIRGLIPLQAALTARAGSVKQALALVAAGPVAKLAAKVVSPT